MEPISLLPTTTKDVASYPGLSKTTPFRISIGRVLLIGLSVAPISVGFFLVMTIVTNFDESTYTHCETFNVMPSLSAVARSNQFGWILVCWWSAAFLLLSSFLYMRLYRRILPRPIRSFSLIFTGSLIIHSFSILCWAHFAHINGTEPLHVITVTVLWSSATIFLIGSFIIRKYYYQDGVMKLTNKDHDSYILKQKLAYTFLGSFAVMWFWYILHMEFCLPLVYSVFAIFEFVSFWSFLAYMCTAYFDFYNLYLCYDQRLGYFISDF